MEIMVSCCDHRRRAALVETRPTLNDTVVGRVQIDGRHVQGEVCYAGNLEYRMSIPTRIAGPWRVGHGTR